MQRCSCNPQMASTHHAPLVREPLLLDIIGGDTDWSTDKLPDDGEHGVTSCGSAAPLSTPPSSFPPLLC